jgi:hypothetical protein
VRVEVAPLSERSGSGRRRCKAASDRRAEKLTPY